MSFNPDTNPRINGDLNVYYGASTSSNATDQPVTWSTLDTSFSNTFTLTKNGSQFTLPNDGKTYILEGFVLSTGSGIYTTFQWYDVTNSTYVGILGKVAGGLNKDEGRYGSIVADEKAIFVTNQNNTYELRLKHAGTSNVDYSSPGLYYSKPRCCIWRL
tara:strand:+ start:89 stop:565 length:477 start_codon:yes stop_codon:yes gene_type:complete